MRQSSLWRPGLAVVWMLAAAVGARAATPIAHARVQFLPAQVPSVYLRIDGDCTVRYASSAQGLARAKPLRPKMQPLARGLRRGARPEYLEYPEIGLSVAGSGLLGARARFRVRPDRQGGATLLLRLAVTRPTPNGPPLTYLFEVGRSLSPPGGPVEDGPLIIPELRAARLLVRTKAEERRGGLLSWFSRPKEAKVGLAVRLWVDSTGTVLVQTRRGPAREQVLPLEIKDVLVHGKSVPVRLEVKDDRGKVVHAKSGTLETFAYT